MYSNFRATATAKTISEDSRAQADCPQWLIPADYPPEQDEP